MGGMTSKPAAQDKFAVQQPLRFDRVSRSDRSIRKKAAQIDEDPGKHPNRYRFEAIGQSFEGGPGR
jgi:hypothetical protein